MSLPQKERGSQPRRNLIAPSTLYEPSQKGEAGMRLDPHPTSVTRNPSDKETNHDER